MTGSYFNSLDLMRMAWGSKSWVLRFWSWRGRFEFWEEFYCIIICRVTAYLFQAVLKHLFHPLALRTSQLTVQGQQSLAKESSCLQVFSEI
jgi:hypothetical protein